ncbi:MAG: PspA-associated protein PspAB [Streptosporangiaceae bacterium]
MGLLDTILGRTKPKQANLDALFALPSAAITLEAATDLVPTGTGSVCFRSTEGRAFADVEKDVCDLLNMTSGQDAPPVKVSQDSYGFTWLMVKRPADQVADLVTDVHAVNSSLQDNGFGPQLLCSLVNFASPKSRVALVYLYKRGTFYPFAPTGHERRDNGLEIRVKAAIEGDLKIEPELTRWFALWDAPGL